MTLEQFLEFEREVDNNYRSYALETTSDEETEQLRAHYFALYKRKEEWKKIILENALIGVDKTFFEDYNSSIR